MPALDIGIAQWALRPRGQRRDRHRHPAGQPLFYLPLVAPMRTRGVLAIEPEEPRWLLVPEQRQQLDTFAALAAIALERVHYVDVAQTALSAWNPSACAIRCWPRCRTTCARR